MINAKEKEFNYRKYKDSEDLLEWFAIWYLKRAKQEKCLPMKTIQNNCIYKSPDSSRTKNSSASALTLYKQENLQVQLCIFPPHTEIPPHTHPNMDSFEVYIGGEPFFLIEGSEPEHHEDLENFDNLKNKESFYNKLFLRSFRITEETVHSANFGKKGGAFLSIQHWKNGVEPASQADDWENK